MLKKLNLILLCGLITVGLNVNAFAEDDFIQEDILIEESVESEPESVVEIQNDSYADEVSVNALNNYVVEGSLFQRITNLEQEKVVMQLEKERAQLDLELERLNAEKIKLQMELDTLSGRAEQQQYEIENAKKQLDIQTEKLKQQIENLEHEEREPVASRQQIQRQEETNVSRKYKLINVVGVDNQLQATVEEIATGQNKRIAVGKELDGYIVKSISLNEGIVFEKDGTEESLNIGK